MCATCGCLVVRQPAVEVVPVCRALSDVLGTHLVQQGDLAGVVYGENFGVTPLLVGTIENLVTDLRPVLFLSFLRLSHGYLTSRSSCTTRRCVVPHVVCCSLASDWADGPRRSSSRSPRECCRDRVHRPRVVPRP